jgi:coproporphyrinogen III oxidase
MKENVGVKMVETEEEKKVANDLVLQYHSYVPSIKTVGRTIKYLISFENNVVGTFWIGSGFKPTPKAILNYFNVGQKDFDKMFNKVADNKRFAMKQSIKNVGSSALKIIRKRAKQDWKDKYGDDLIAIITTIGSGKSGSVYMADNWKFIGETAGLPKNRTSVSMKWNDTTEIKKRYVKPDGKDKKKIFITNKL